MITRRCLSLMLVICMCISVIPFMTFADDIPFIEIPEPAEDLSEETLTPDVEPSGTEYPVIGEPVMMGSAAVSGDKVIVTETRYVFLDTVFADKGVLTADRSSASAGDIVTLALTTAAYYGLTENGIKAYKGDSSEETDITLSDNGNGTWTFEMPDGDYDTLKIVADIEWKNAPPALYNNELGFGCGFFINSDTAHGEVFATFSDDNDLQTGETTVTAADGMINAHILPKTITLSAIPEYGYELTGWSVEACDPITGEPCPQGWTLPVERVGGADRFEIGIYDQGAGAYSFRISAAFAEQPELSLPVYRSITVENNDLSGEIYPAGCYAAADKETALPGETVTVSLFTQPGADPATTTEGAELSIYYMAPDGSLATADWTKADDNTYTFVMPDADVTVSARFAPARDTIVRAPLRAAAVASPTGLWVEHSDTNNIPTRIDLFEVKIQTGFNTRTVYQLYLPGNVDPSNCFLSWDGGASAAVGGHTYQSGECPVPSPNSNGTETAYTFKDGDTTLTTLYLITYRGSAAVPAVFIEIDESDGKPTIAQMDGDIDHEITCSGDIYIDGVKYGLSKIKGRGNATWKESQDKKPYNITLDSKIYFPGVDSEETKKWSLLAENLDRSLLGNRAGYHLAYEMGIGQDTASADVWMNGEYQGCYTVTPKTDSFVTNDGFMIEQDNYLEKSVAEGGDPQFTLEGLNEASGWSSCYNRITVKKMGNNLLMNNGAVDESPENMTAAAARIQTWLQEAWDAMRSDSGYNSKGKYYTDYIDIESFAKMYLMHEYVKSYDVCAGSILFHRDGQTDADKLIAGPLWDLDNAMGSTYQNSSLGKADDRRNGDRRSAQGDFISNVTEYKTSIYKTLRKHADFMEEVVYQYNKNRSFFDALGNEFEQMSNDIEASAVMNHKKVIDLGNGTGKNNHYYRNSTTLGSGQYSQSYLATPSADTGWSTYVDNMDTYITVRSLWFNDNYTDPDYVAPEDCAHSYEVIENYPASCTGIGSVTYKCPICRDVYKVVLPQIPHDYLNGVCASCGETLLTAAITCDPGSSVTVYETQDINGPKEENCNVTHPHNSDTGLIDCAGDGQINFEVILAPGYTLESVSAAPGSSYKNLKLPSETGIPNLYRLTKVKGDLTLTVTTQPQIYTITYELDGGAVEGENPANYTITDGGITLINPTKAGCTFAGWIGTGLEGPTEYVTIEAGSTGDREYTATWTVDTVVINGVSGSFNDKIKLNYYFSIPDSVLADDGAYVTLTNTYTGHTVTLPVKGAAFVNGIGYRFSIPLAAKEASDPIAVRVFDGQGCALTIVGASGTDYTETGVQYTLMQYFSWLESNGTDNEKAVGAAAKDYCAAAQIYFGYNSDGLTVSDAVDAVTDETLSGYISVREGELPEGVIVRGISAMLESDNTLRLYLGFDGVDPTSFTYRIDGDIAELKQRKDGSYYLALDTGVFSNHLQYTHTYSVSDGTYTHTITASVLTYARSCTIDSDETESDLGKALYLYNQAAVANFGQ